MPEFRQWGDCTIPDELRKRFYDHLDECKQCRENPFDLCLMGKRIMSDISLKMAQMPILVKTGDDERMWPEKLDPRGVEFDPIFVQEHQRAPEEFCQICGHYKQCHEHGTEEKPALKWCRGTSHAPCDCELYLSKENSRERDLLKFRTSDGYTFMFLAGLWVDSFDPDTRDLAFRGDMKGPIDSGGQRVPGTLSCCGRDTDGDGNCPIHESPGVVRRRYR
jgi:hypothetical protein